jgi:hypothetical protein
MPFKLVLVARSPLAHDLKVGVNEKLILEAGRFHTVSVYLLTLQNS